MKFEKRTVFVGLLILVVICIGVVIVFGNNKDLNSKNKNIIGETDISKKSYGYPVISMLSEEDGYITISAGIYRFGDIDQDGVVGYEDIEALKIMINTNKVGFSESQIELADVNEDGSIDKKDVDMFNKYLNTNGEVKYDLNIKLLEFCLTDVDDSSTCKWETTFKFKPDSKQDYYAFVRQTNNKRVSRSVLLESKVFEKLGI